MPVPGCSEGLAELVADKVTQKLMAVDQGHHCEEGVTVCPSCRRQGIAEAFQYYEAIPEVTKAREHHEFMQTKIRVIGTPNEIKGLGTGHEISVEELTAAIDRETSKIAQRQHP